MLRRQAAPVKAPAHRPELTHDDMDQGQNETGNGNWGVLGSELGAVRVVCGSLACDARRSKGGEASTNWRGNRAWGENWGESGVMASAAGVRGSGATAVV